jgi:hypothetical protein
LLISRRIRNKFENILERESGAYRWDCLMNKTRGRESRDTVSLNLLRSSIEHKIYIIQ